MNLKVNSEPITDLKFLANPNKKCTPWGAFFHKTII